MKLSRLLNGFPCRTLQFRDAEVASLCTDSRVAEAGDLFFCFRGTHTDSHAYAAEAARRGVCAVVCERECAVSCPQIVVSDGREAMARLAAAFYGHPEREMRLCAVTGTNGKTTTAHMLHSVLEAAGEKAGLIGTLGARFGETTLPPDLTTPDPVTLFSLLADMKRAGVRTCVMEVSAHALALKKVCPIVFDTAVFTNLTQDHLDFFPSLEAYGAAKALLFRAGTSRFAVLNADDPFSARLNGELPHLTYGQEGPADSFAVIESETLRGSRLLLNLSDELCECTLSLTGRHNVYNALAAATAAQHLGVAADAISRGLSSLSGVDGRLEWVANFRGADVFVDFAHTPDGLEKSLAALKEHCCGRLLLLFGCGGNRDADKRAKMGETAAKYCDFIVLTSDNPRYEDPCAIIAQIEQGVRRRSRRYVCVQDREKGTAYALGLCAEGDILLVAGKGGETCQEIMGIKYSYNDKDVIRKLIGG